MVQFQKLTRNLFLTLHGHNVHRQQRRLSKFLMRYQQFASHTYRGASFQDGVAAGKGFLCAPFWGVQICDYSAARNSHCTNLDSRRCWRCTLCPCKVRNKFLVNFWNCTIHLCIPSISLLFPSCVSSFSSFLSRTQSVFSIWSIVCYVKKQSTQLSIYRLMR